LFAVYVHIPICAHKCYYCDFHSRPVPASERMRYLQALCSEIRLCPHKGSPAQTLFLGGGTPSELTGDEIERIVSTLDATFEFSEDSEWTIECNPGTVSPASCDRLAELGFDRVSLGAQTFNDDILKRLGRIHNAAQAERSFEWFRAAGFENLSIDLMFGIPGQSFADWRASLVRALDLGPEHLSLYSLSIEPGTPFGHLRDCGAMQEPPDELVADMYELAMDLTRDRGYHQYEISNYCLPGLECRHNLAYWNNSPYLGFGVSAASYVDGRRWSNTCDWEDYFEGAANGRVPRVNEEHLDWKYALGEEVMLQIRTARGVSVAKLSRKYRCDFEGLFRPSIDFLRSQDLIVKEGELLRLTRRGKLLANEVCLEFLESAKLLQEPGE